MGDQLRLHVVRHHRHRDGGAVSARRNRPGDRRGAAGLLGALRRAHRRREPGRPRAHVSVARHVGAQYRPDHPGPDRAGAPQPGIGLDPGRRFPGGARQHPPPVPPTAAAPAQPRGGMILRALDRYVLGSWVRIFVLTSLGFPLVSIMINLTDNLNKLLDRGLTMQQIAISYVYSIPENMFIVMPAAVLFATVFTVGAMGRYSELTAAKASGQSFHRLMLPVFVAAALTSVLAFLVGELAPGA